MKIQKSTGILLILLVLVFIGVLSLALTPDLFGDSKAGNFISGNSNQKTQEEEDAKVVEKNQDVIIPSFRLSYEKILKNGTKETLTGQNQWTASDTLAIKFSFEKPEEINSNQEANIQILDEDKVEIWQKTETLKDQASINLPKITKPGKYILKISFPDSKKITYSGFEVVG